MRLLVATVRTSNVVWANAFMSRLSAITTTTLIPPVEMLRNHEAERPGSF
jgi:hypothetical protein